MQLPWIELFSDFSPLCSLHKCFYLRLGNHASSEAGGPHSNVSKFHHSLWTFLKGGGQTSLRISKLLLQGLRGFHFFFTLLHDHEEVIPGRLKHYWEPQERPQKYYTRVVCKYYVEAVDGLGQHNVDGLGLLTTRYIEVELHLQEHSSSELLHMFEKTKMKNTCALDLFIIQSNLLLAQLMSILLSRT